MRGNRCSLRNWSGEDRKKSPTTLCGHLMRPGSAVISPAPVVEHANERRLASPTSGLVCLLCARESQHINHTKSDQRAQDCPSKGTPSPEPRPQRCVVNAIVHKSNEKSCDNSKHCSHEQSHLMFAPPCKWVHFSILLSFAQRERSHQMPLTRTLSCLLTLGLPSYSQSKRCRMISAKWEKSNAQRP